MKLVIVIGQLGVGGGERQLYLLLKNIDRVKFDPVVVSFNPGRNDYWEKPIQDLGVPLLFIRRSRNPVSRIVALFKLIGSERPHILLSWTLHLNFFAALAGRFYRVPRIIGSIRNDLFNPMKKDRPLHRFLGTKGPHVFIANSSKGKRDMVERLKIPGEKIQVVFNAIEVSVPAGTVPLDRKALNLPEDVFLIVNVGRLETSKNQAMLISALKLVRDQSLDVRAVFIGEGPERDALKALAKSLEIEPYVYFTGKIPMVVNYLHLFQVMCHTGLADGMPNVLLEAASRGLPLLSTSVNGADDIIVEGETGYIVAYNDAHAMAGRIAELYHDAGKRNKMGTAAQQYVLSKSFSIPAMVADFERIFAS